MPRVYVFRSAKVEHAFSCSGFLKLAPASVKVREDLKLALQISSRICYEFTIIFKCSPDRLYQKVAFDNHYVMKFGNRANFMSILCKSQTAQNTACCTIPKWPLKDHKNVSKTLKADPERK